MKSINANAAANTAAALNIKINRAKRTIEISKTFEKAASRYGSDEYIALTAAQQDNPGFSVKIISAKSKNTNPYAGLDYDFIQETRSVTRPSRRRTGYPVRCFNPICLCTSVWCLQKNGKDRYMLLIRVEKHGNE